MIFCWGVHGQTKLEKAQEFWLVAY